MCTSASTPHTAVYDVVGCAASPLCSKYVPETLIVALQELEDAYAEASKDPAFLVR